MDRNTAKIEIRRLYDCRTLLMKSEHGDYICPFCGSGTGPNKSGAVKWYSETNTFFCHKCRATGDAINLYEQKNDMDYNEALFAMAQELGITIDEPSERAHRLAGSPQRHETDSGGIIGQDAQSGLKTPLRGAGDVRTPGIMENSDNNSNTHSDTDFTEYFKACAARLADPQAVAYLTGRGISIDTAESCGIGFDPKSDPANAPGAMGDEGKMHPCPRLIIPSGAAYYVGRRTDGIIEYAKLNARGSKPGIFNARAISHEVQKVFVCEGAFDALSVIEAGGAAIALNSVNNGAALLDLLSERETAATFILCPDNDTDEGTAAKVRGRFEELADELRGNGYSCVIEDINGSHKDANEYLTEDRSGFMKTISDIMDGREPAEQEPTKDTEQDTSTAATIDYFLSHGAFDTPKTKIETGFDDIDSKLGGLYEGVYVLSAAPSIGKTTFALQLADQIAERGADCLYFAFEQSKIELVSKSIARFCAIQNGENPTGPSAIEIRNGECTDDIRRAAQAYRDKVSKHMYIIEGDASYNALKISETVSGHIGKHSGRPVVFIDYLQIIPRTEEAKRQDMRGNVDTTVTELRRLARREHITVFVISSVSRENYNTPSTLDEYKESGGIEYSADAAFSMNLAAAEDTKETDRIKRAQAIQKAKNAQERTILITVLKSRYTQPGEHFPFMYYPKVELFKAGTGKKAVTGWEDAPRV